MEFNGCDKCKFFCVAENEEPCVICKHGREVPNQYPDLFEPADDPVNSPAHYARSCSLECIDVMEVTFGKTAVRNFCLCNAFKYMWRYENKNGQEDLQKAKWYLDRAGIVQDDQYNRLMDLWVKCHG